MKNPLWDGCAAGTAVWDGAGCRGLLSHAGGGSAPVPKQCGGAVGPVEPKREPGVADKTAECQCCTVISVWGLQFYLTIPGISLALKNIFLALCRLN